MSEKQAGKLRFFLNSTYKIYHNPRCSKSRLALQHLVDLGLRHSLIPYLEQGLSKAEIKDLSTLLKMPVENFVRKNDDAFKRVLKKPKTENEWTDCLINFPQLLQRPIIIKNNKQAIIARPPQDLASFTQT